MNKSFVAVLLGTLLGASAVPSLAMAQSAFEGTWKIDLKQIEMPKKPVVLLLQDGTFQCKTCTPPLTVAADGTDQPVSGHPSYDTLAVTVVDDHTIRETEKKDGKLVSESTMTVAADGNTVNEQFSDSSGNSPEPVTGNASLTRVAKGPNGAHAISGSWQMGDYGSVSDNALTRSFHLDGDMFSMTSPTGESYSAKLDGSDAPYKGDPGTTSVSVKQLGPRVIQETDMRDGKVTSVAKMTVAPDGKSMTVAADNKLAGTQMSFVAIKQ